MTGPLSGDGRAADGRSRLHTGHPGQAPWHGMGTAARLFVREPGELDTRPLVPEQGAEGPMSRATALAPCPGATSETLPGTPATG